MQVNNGLVVAQVWNAQPPEKTLEGALAFLLRLIAALPQNEAAGLLLKPSGENIVPYMGQMVSAGRIAYPDGQIFKVLTDVPTTNGPTWDDDGMVDSSRYLKVGDVVIDPPKPCDLSPVLARLADLQKQLDATFALLTLVGDQYRDFRSDMVARFNDDVKRTNELKAIAQQPQHYEGSVKVFGVGGSVSMDRKS